MHLYIFKEHSRQHCAFCSNPPANKQSREMLDSGAFTPVSTYLVISRQRGVVRNKTVLLVVYQNEGK